MKYAATIHSNILSHLNHVAVKTCKIPKLA